MQLDTLAKIFLRLGVAFIAIYFIMLLTPIIPPTQRAWVGISSLPLGGIFAILRMLADAKAKADKASVTRGRKLFTIGWVASLLAIPLAIPLLAAPLVIPSYWVQYAQFFNYYLVFFVYWFILSVFTTLTYGIILRKELRLGVTIKK